MPTTVIKALAIVACLFAAACAPTVHFDAPAMPALSGEQTGAGKCTQVERPAVKIAPLDPRPVLPDANQSPCPAGSGLYACFMADQDLARQKRFKILYDDREYCRDAYDRAVKRVAQ